MNQVSPAQWRSRVDYDSKNWKPWNPDKWVVHYGGGAVSNHDAGPAREMEVLRAWEWWHLNGQGWLGIAYNYAIGQSGNLYRLRGEQRSGATSGDEDSDGIPENYEARAVVFILGGDQKPSPAALATFSRFWATDPMRVIGHRDSTRTPCPGEHLYAWIQQKGYEMAHTHKPMPEDLPRSWADGIWEQWVKRSGTNADTRTHDFYREDLSWVYDRVIAPLERKNAALEKRVGALERKIDGLTGQVEFDTEKVSVVKSIRVR